LPSPAAALFLAAAAGILASPALAQQPAQEDPATRQLAQQCFACHGPDGNSANPKYPILAGQGWRYIFLQLRDFKEGRRSNPEMSPMAAKLTRDQMIALGNFFAAQKQRPAAFAPDDAKVQAGKKVADAALCTMCHLGEFKGQNEIPRVAGQWPQYIAKQLEDFRAKRRTNDAGNMTSVTRNLTDEQIQDLAQYIANLT
jgi:cytochrome c553